MSTKIETRPKTATTSDHPTGHDCCGGDSEPSSKPSKAAEPEAAGRSTQSAPVKSDCCCGGAKSNPTDPKR